MGEDTEKAKKKEMTKKPGIQTVKYNIHPTSMMGTMNLVLSPSKFPEDKRQREKFIVEKFANRQKIEGRTLSSIEINEDDADGKPDIIAKLGSDTIGIQVTELKISHRPNSQHVAARLSKNLLDKVLNHVRPSTPLFVDIFSNVDSQNKILKLKNKQVDALAKAIAEEISREDFSDIYHQSSNPHRYQRVRPPPSLQDKITDFTIAPIPTGWRTGAMGRDNLYINFHFNNVRFCESSLRELAKNINEKKADSVTDVLLVWCRDNDFWGEEENIVKILREESQNSNFRNIYLLCIFELTGSGNAFQIKP